MTRRIYDGFDISDMGEAGLQLQIAGPMDIESQEKIWRMARSFGDWTGVSNAIAGVNNILVLFDPDQTDADRVSRDLAAAWASPATLTLDRATFRVPVQYGGNTGKDLQEIAENTGLCAADVIRRHAAGEYVVMTVGAYPGFGFLGGLDPKLATPRRAAPRSHVKKGSVMIGGAQTAVMSVDGPSGWNIIGHTEMPFFDPTANRPSVLRPGDIVTFYEEDAQ
jgi:KipI family sensor histidine kinase inhibitor